MLCPKLQDTGFSERKRHHRRAALQLIAMLCTSGKTAGIDAQKIHMQRGFVSLRIPVDKSLPDPRFLLQNFSQ